MLRKILPYLLIIFLSIFSVRSLFKPGYFPLHDSAHPQRINQMEKALSSGQIPPRWSPDGGYGYGWPQFSFYSPLPYYFGALISLLTKDVLVSTKILFIIAIICSGLFMYLFVKEIFGPPSGIVAAVLYIYSPYHALDLYVRGALAELWGIMFIPLVLFFIVKSIKEQKLKWIVFSGLSYAALILSHNITSLIFTGFFFLGFILYLSYSKNDKQKLLITNYFLLITFLGLLLSCYFWLPAIFEAKYIHLNWLTPSQFSYRQHFIAFRQIWDSPWGYGASAGIFSGISYMVGKLHLLLIIPSLIFSIANRKKYPSQVKLLLIFGLYFLISTLMTNQKSDLIWANFSFLKFVQYPWRFLIFTMFSISVLSSSLIFYLPNKRVKYLVLMIIISTLISINLTYFKPKKYLDIEKTWFESKGALTVASSESKEYLPIWRPQKKVLPPKELISLSLDKKTVIKESVSNYQFLVNLPKEEEVVINIAYFPGWQVLVDNKIQSINFLKDGLIRFNCKKGEHSIIVNFEETRLRFLANAISASTLFLLLSFFMLK